MDVNEKILQRLDELLAEGKRAFYTMDRYVPDEWWRPLAASALSAIAQITGDGSIYYRQFSEQAIACEQRSPRTAVGILQRVRDDYAKGHLRDVRELAAAEVFTDFLEMAGHLHSEGYKDAAASIAGAVLEDSLRRLHLKHIGQVQGMSSISKLNDALRKATVYGQAVWRQIQVWGDIRNDADHGHFGKVDAAAVKQMILGIGDFLAKHEG